MGFEHILVERSGDFATDHDEPAAAAQRPVAGAHARADHRVPARSGTATPLGVVLAGNGPVFSSGHDLAEVAGADLPAIR